MKRVGAPGFTIVELLIVVVVIAILAAITIVSYNGITNQAHDTAVKSDLSNLRKKIELYNAEQGKLPHITTETTTAAAGFKASKGSYMVEPVTGHNLIYCMYTSGTPSAVVDYSIIGYSKSGKKFRVNKDGTVQEYTTAWTDQTVACADSMPNYTLLSNFRGYASDDTTGGPWRAWVGGN